MKKYIILSVLMAISFSVSANLCRSQKTVRDFNRQHGNSRNPAGMVVDHICPLACGGLDITTNMQYQTIADSKAKDSWEITKEGCSKLCNSSNSKPTRTVFNCK